MVDMRLRRALRDAELVLNERSVMALRKKEHNLGFTPREKITVGNRLALGMEAALRAATLFRILRCLLRLIGFGSGSLLCSGIFLVKRGDVLFQGFRSLINVYSFSWGGDNRLHFALARGQHVSEDERKQNE